MNRNGFQNFVNQQQPPAQAGDFADTNPRMSAVAPAEGFKAAPGGLYVARFGWGSPSNGTLSNYFQAAALLAFIHRENQALITDWMGLDSLLIPGGYPAVGMSRGAYWALFVAGAEIGDTVYADALTGIASADAAGNSTESLGFTASINGTTLVMTVTAVVTPTLADNMVVIADGVPAGTYIVDQLTGAAGDTGTYQLAVSEGQEFAGNVGSSAMDAYGLIATPFTVATSVKPDAAFTADIDDEGVMTVSAVASGVLEVGQFIEGTDVLSYSRITALISGTGGTGTYQTTSHAVAASTSMTATQGQVGKITTW